MLRRLIVTLLSATALVAAAPAASQLNLYCSSPNTAWCQGMAVGFAKATGVRVAVVQKATGETRKRLLERWDKEVGSIAK